MLDDQDIIKLQSILATKQDISGLRTELKQDISDSQSTMLLTLASKDELKQEILGLRTELKQDISDSQDKIMSVVATRVELQEVRKDMADLKKLVQGLIVSTDKIATAISNLSIEYAAISTQLSRHELWIKQIAEKVGLKLVTE